MSGRLVQSLVGGTASGSLVARGSGGRSSVSGIVAAVFGSTGFLGRYVVNQLGRMGSQVIVPWRGDELDFRHLKPMGDLGQIVPMEFDFRDAASLDRALAPANAVINLVGKPYATRYYSMQDVHVTAPEVLAQAAKDHGITTFVHVSCANPDENSPSSWIRTKALGEKKVREIMPSATIIRPTDIFGSEDRFLTRMARLLLRVPVVPLVNDGKSLVQPVYVGDVASAITAAARDPEAFGGRAVELGGPSVFSVRDMLEFVSHTTRREKVALPVPRIAAEALFTILQTRLPLLNTVPEFTRDDVRRELTNVVLSSRSRDEPTIRFEDLDIVPQEMIGDLGGELLRQFRKGGDRSALFHMD